ncbi:MAG: site-specific integrase [Eubacteriaceae bacterium]
MPKKKNNRSPHGAGSIYQRKDGRWVAQFIYIDSVTSQEKTKYLYRKSQGEAQKALTAALAKVHIGTYVEPSKLLLQEWMQTWMETYKKPRAKSTQIKYQNDINNHIKPSLGSIPLSRLTPHRIQSAVNQWQGKGLSPKSIRNIALMLSGALTQASKLGYISQNPCNLIDLPTVPKVMKKALDIEDITRFFEVAKGNPYESLYIIDLFLGARQSELLGLSWDCVDFTDKTIHLYRQLSRFIIKGEGVRYEFLPLKECKERRVFPPQIVFDALKEVKTVQNEWAEKAGEIWYNPENLVFTNEIGHHVNHVTVARHLKKLLKEIGLGNESFHTLRHTSGSLAIEAGANLKAVQENLGHATASYTLATYIHTTEAIQKNAADVVNEYLKNKL